MKPETPSLESSPVVLPLPHEPVHTWSFLKHSVETNTLGDLHRSPHQLSQYQAWAARTKASYGSVPNFIIKKRLEWINLAEAKDQESAHQEQTAPAAFEFEAANATPFADPRDFKILRNDWPYGVEPGITHLCVWLKNRLPMDEVGDSQGRRGRLNKDMRDLVESWVAETFTRPIKERAKIRGENAAEEDMAFGWDTSSNGGGDAVRVLWFKNWVDLQSVRGIDHIHVLIRSADTDANLIQKWFN